LKQKISHLPRGYVGAQRRESPPQETTTRRMRSFAMGDATVELEEIPDYVITDAHMDYTKSGTVTSANLSVSISFALTGNAYGKVARFRVTDKNNQTAILAVRVMPTLYSLPLHLGQMIPEIVRPYTTIVSEADPTFTNVAAGMPSSTHNQQIMDQVGVPPPDPAYNASSPTTSSGTLAHSSSRQLMQAPVSGACCSSPALSPVDIEMCRAPYHMTGDIEEMPYTTANPNALDSFCGDGSHWDSLLAESKMFPEFKAIPPIVRLNGETDEAFERRTTARSNRIVCGMSIMHYMSQDPKLVGMPSRNKAIATLLAREEYAHFQIARGQNTMQCVLPERDAKNHTTDTTGIPCTPDFNRPLLQLAKPGWVGLYETVGAPCPCAPQTNRYYRTCTLNPWDSKLQPYDDLNAGSVQKCMFVPFEAADAEREAALEAASGSATNGGRLPGPPSHSGQGYCMPYAVENDPTVPPNWIGNMRNDLFKEQTYKYKDCDQEGDMKIARISTNTAFASLSILTGGWTLISMGIAAAFGKAFGSWPFPKICPTVTAYADDYSYRGNELITTANQNVDDADALMSLIGDQTKAMDVAKQIAIKANDISTAITNVSQANFALLRGMRDTFSATQKNMDILNTRGKNIQGRVRDAQAEVETSLTQMMMQINETRARLARFEAEGSIFYTSMNLSLTLQDELIDRQQTQLQFLTSTQKRNRRALSDLSSQYSRLTQGRDPYRRAMKNLQKTFTYAVKADGLLPFVTTARHANNRTLYGVAPRLPHANESNLIVDRSWVYFGTATRPPRYAGTPVTMEGTTRVGSPSTRWLTQQVYELKCSLGFLSSLTHTTVTMDTIKTYLGTEGCDPDLSFDDNKLNVTDGTIPSPCDCVIQVTERICATTHTSTDAFLSAIHDPLRNVYTDPLGSTNVGDTGYAEAHACEPTTEFDVGTRVFRSAVEFDAFLTDSCVGREQVPMLSNAAYGPIVYATQENGLNVFHVRDWRDARDATRAIKLAPITLADFTSRPVSDPTTGKLSQNVWNTAFLTNQSRTDRDWCTAVPRDMMLQSSASRVQLLPQRYYSYLAYTFMRFMGSPFLREMDVALNGRAPVFGVAQAYHAYDTEPHPSDVSTTQPEPLKQTMSFPATGNRTEFELLVEQATESMRAFERPHKCLEHMFVATGPHMTPVYHPRVGRPVRNVSYYFQNANDLVVMGAGAGGVNVNISQSDVDFLNSQLQNRTLSKDQTASFGASLSLLRGIETITGYLSCMFDAEMCELPQLASQRQGNDEERAKVAAGQPSNPTGRGWYTYDPDATNVAPFARTLAQRHGDMNYIRTRVPYVHRVEDTPSMRDLGWNATNRRPMVSAQTFLFEEVLQPSDPETYRILHNQLLRISQESPPRVNWDLLDLNDPQLQTMMHSLMLSPVNRYDPAQAGFNPDTQRVQLMDLTDRTYMTDPDVGAIRTTTPAGAPNVISRRSMSTKRGAKGTMQEFLDAFNVVRDPRPFGVDLPERHDPDHADTWRTLYVVPVSEVVSVTIVISQMQIDQLFQVHTTCPRNVRMNQATSDTPIISLVRPSPDQTTRLRFNVTTANGNQTCDGLLHVDLPPASRDQLDDNSVFDIMYVNLTDSCRDLRRVELVRLFDDDEREVTCWSWRMDGANTRLPAGEHTLYTAQSTVDTDHAYAIQKIATDMSNVIDTLDVQMFAILERKLDLLAFAAASGMTLADAEGHHGGANMTDDLEVARERLRQALNATMFNAPPTVVTDPEEVLVAMRGVINQTEIDRLVNISRSSSNLNALVQSIREEDEKMILLNAAAYQNVVAAPVISVRDLLSSARYELMRAAVANTISNQPVDWDCMARLQEAAIRNVTVTGGLSVRLRALASAVKRQDESCRPGFHNFWMFGTVNERRSHGTTDGMMHPETIHFTGPFCSNGGNFGLGILWMLIMLALNMTAYSLAKRLLFAMGTPGSRCYSRRLERTGWYQFILNQRTLQHSVYKRYMGEQPLAGGVSNSEVDYDPSFEQHAPNTDGLGLFQTQPRIIRRPVQTTL